MFIFRFLLCAFYLCLPSKLYSQEISQSLEFSIIPGKLVVQDPLAIELILSPGFQRLKGIYQYGVNEFTLPPKPYHYTRFDHSLGVYKILKDKNVSRMEQIAGLLHDASHTVFSHTMDAFFQGGMNKGAYQDQEGVHESFLKKYGFAEILEKYGLEPKDVLSENPGFNCLEQSHPRLCADRIQYILEEGCLDEIITRDDAERIYQDLVFDGKNWYFQSIEQAERFSFFSLTGTLNTWGCHDNILIALCVRDITKFLVADSTINLEDVCFNFRDEEMWALMLNSPNHDVQKRLKISQNIHEYYDFHEENGGEGYKRYFGKFRGVDPLVLVDGSLKPLTEISPTYKRDYNAVKETMSRGWSLKVHGDLLL